MGATFVALSESFVKKSTFPEWIKQGVKLVRCSQTKLVDDEKQDITQKTSLFLRTKEQISSGIFHIKFRSFREINGASQCKQQIISTLKDPWRRETKFGVRFELESRQNCPNLPSDWGNKNEKAVITSPTDFQLKY